MGRTSLLLIIAFNVTFMMMGFRMSNATSAAYEKYSGYLDIEQSGLAMESCANIAIANALLDTARSSTINLCSNKTFFGKAGSNFSITQFPYLDPITNMQIGESLLVVANYPLTGTRNPFTGQIEQMYDTTYVKVQGNSISQYVFYSVNDNSLNWNTGDTCRGRYHTQSGLSVNGNADFKGRVTTKGAVQVANGANPNFEQGYGKADVSLPTDLRELNKYGAMGGATSIIKKLDTYVQLNSDGSVTVRTEPPGTVQSSTTCWNESSTAKNASPNGNIPKCTTYTSIAALTTSGVLLVQNAALHIKGVLNGQLTLGCVDTVNGSGVKSNLSQVWIDGSITYKQDPPCSRNPHPNNPTNEIDMLGIVASNNITVSQYVDHNGTAKVTLKNVNIDASMFTQGSFGAENYDSRGDCGDLTIVGGIQQNVRGAVVQYTSPINGFHKDYDWDNNLLTHEPVGYPRTVFVVKNWVDVSKIPDDFWQ